MFCIHHVLIASIFFLQINNTLSITKNNFSLYTKIFTILTFFSFNKYIFIFVLSNKLELNSKLLKIFISYEIKIVHFKLQVTFKFVFDYILNDKIKRYFKKCISSKFKI